jgi:hypothetical protein
MMHRANTLAKRLDQRVVLIQHQRRPHCRRHLHQSILRLTRIRTPPNKAKPLRHPQMVAVDTQSATSQRAEVNHRRAGLRTHTIETLQPRANLLSAIALEKIERERATPLSNLF